MGEHGQGGKWIAPEDVPDPIALRGVSIPRVPASHLAPPTLDLGSLDPLDPPSLEAVHAALEPTPPTAVYVEVIDEPTEIPRRHLPAAVWIGGTLLLVAVLSMGLRMLTAGAGVPAPDLPAAPPAVRPEVVAPATDPVPVDAAGTASEADEQRSLGGSRSRRADGRPRQAAVRPMGDAAPPTATVRPLPVDGRRMADGLTPPASASLEPGAADPVNPWSEVEP